MLGFKYDSTVPNLRYEKTWTVDLLFHLRSLKEVKMRYPMNMSTGSGSNETKAWLEEQAGLILY